MAGGLARQGKDGTWKLAPKLLDLAYAQLIQLVQPSKCGTMTNGECLRLFPPVG